MPDMIVHRHGDRWSVREADAESPVKEFPSREAAEMAAEQMAAGGTVRLIDQDPSDLGAAGDEIVETGLDAVKAVDAAERSRSPQSGV